MPGDTIGSERSAEAASADAATEAMESCMRTENDARTTGHHEVAS